jgi:hypothetical protein
MFLKIRFEVRYRRTGQDDYLKVEISVLKGLIRYRTEVPVIELNHCFLRSVLKLETDTAGPVSYPAEDQNKVIKIPITLTVLRKLPFYLEKALAFLRRYRRVFRKLLKSVRIRQVNWTTEIGLGDPAGTGIAAGLLWGIQGYIYKVLQSKVGPVERRPRLLVLPCFDSTCFRLDFHCIFDLRIGHIIIAGLNFVKLRLRP